MKGKIDINSQGCIRCFNEKGDLHRDGDLPAVICAYGTQYWYKNGKEYFPKGQQ